MDDDQAAKGRFLMRNLAKAYADSRRRAEEVKERAARLSRAMGQRSASKKPQEPPRSTLESEGRILRAVKAAVKAGDVVCLAARAGPAVSDMRSGRKPKKELVQTDQAQNEDRKKVTFLVPHWDHAGDDLKILSFNKVVHDQKGMVMTIRLSDEVMEAALKRKRGFSAHIMNRLNTALRDVLGEDCGVPDFAFVIEAAHSKDPHLHGVIVCPDEPQARKAVRAALRAAGGDWSSDAPQNQVDLKPIEEPVGWAYYMQKWSTTTPAHIGGGSVLGATNGMRRKAKDWYQSARSSGEPIA